MAIGAFGSDTCICSGLSEINPCGTFAGHRYAVLCSVVQMGNGRTGLKLIKTNSYR